MNRLFKGIAAAGLALASTITVSATWAQDKAPVRIAVVLRINTEPGFKTKQMVEQMVADQNAKGGVDGRKLDVVYYNEGCVPNMGIDAVTRAIEQDKVHLILGPACSGVTLAVVPIAARLETPHITSMSTASSITEQGSEWVFRVAVPDRYHAASLADYLVKDLGKKKIAILHETEAMGAGYARDFMSHLKELGVEPVAVESAVPGDSDFRAQLIKIKSADPDALALFLHEAESARTLVQAKSVGISDSVVRAGGSTLSSKEFPTLAANTADKVIFTGTFNAFDTRDDIKAYSKWIYDTYGLYPDQNFAQTTDVMNIVFKVLASTPIEGTDASLKADRRVIRDALAKVSDQKGLAGTVTFCAEPTPQCRDGNKVARIHQYEGGGAEAKIITVK